MTTRPLPFALAALALAAMTSAQAQNRFDQFTPLATNIGAGALPDAAPLQLANPNWTQRTLADRTSQLAQGQANSGNWDMITANETGPQAGRFLFAPFETGTGGVQRTDLTTGLTRTIVQPGTQGFVAGDASRWTPWGSYLTAEESWGSTSAKGRLFEVTNPLANTSNANFVHRNVLPRVSHEGLAFDKRNALYFIDELNGGSIYKFVSANPNATNGDDYFSAGQTFVALVNGGSNANATGALSWAPITDAQGQALYSATAITREGVNTVDGRAAADLAGGTNYQRPEDLEVKTLANGRQILYVATTTTHQVYAFHLDEDRVTTFADRATIDAVTGLAVGNALTNPDNLAIDNRGNLYIIEDQPGGLADIWFARDDNDDGVAESLGRWASLSTVGAEPTGLYFDKFNSSLAYLNVQHPADGVDRLLAIQAVPEPETYALMAAGLGVVAFVARRRRSRQG